MKNNKTFFILQQKIKREGIIMCKACEVGKIVVNKCLSKGIFINTQKLQKLLSLMQIECVKRANKILFKEDIVVWDCGVAIKEVDTEFCSEAIEFKEEQVEYITLLDKEEESVDFIICNYGNLSAFEINELPEIQGLIKIGTPSKVSGIVHIKSEEILRRYSPNENQ